MKTSPILLAALLIVPRTFAAETEAVPESAAFDAPAPVTFESHENHPAKSKQTAYAWMLGATILPWAAGGAFVKRDAIVPGAVLVSSALLFGPSAGQFYGEAHGQGVTGIFIRIGGVAVAAGGVALAYEYARHSYLGLPMAGLAIIGGGAVWAGGVAYSIRNTPRAVDRYNDRARKASVKTSFAPALFPTSDGKVVPGVALSATF